MKRYWTWTSADELIREVEVGDSPECSDHPWAEFIIPRNMGLARNIVWMLSFRNANFQLFKELVDVVSWEVVLKDQRADHS